MIRTYRILSALFDYPSAEALAHEGEMPAVLRAEGILTEAEVRAVEKFLADAAAEGGLRARQAAYSALFDTGSRESLYLFDYVYGESRDRGQAMVDLRGTYEKAGFAQDGRELPDYLPVFLEFAALQPAAADARRLLAEIGAVLDAMEQKFVFRKHPYAPLVTALNRLAHQEA